MSYFERISILQQPYRLSLDAIRVPDSAFSFTFSVLKVAIYFVIVILPSDAIRVAAAVSITLLHL